LFCENCGLQFLPVQSVCTRCGATSTRHWFQLMSLVTLVIAASCNALVACVVLPRLAAGHAHRLAVGHEGFAMRAWLWTDLKAAVYGWIALAAALLAWDYFVRQDSHSVMSEKIKGWTVRALLILAFVPGLAPLFPRGIRPPAALLVATAKLPHLPALPTAVSGLTWLLPWGMVGVAAALLCINAQTRDSLLGHGRVLGAVSLVVLAVVLMLTLLAFRA
jgi:hypothetical protein